MHSYTRFSYFLYLCSWNTNTTFCIGLGAAQLALATSMEQFEFACIGASMTEDERVISHSLQHFAHLIRTIEDERDRMVNCIWQLCLHSTFYGFESVSSAFTFEPLSEQLGSISIKREFGKQCRFFYLKLS